MIPQNPTLKTMIPDLSHPSSASPAFSEAPPDFKKVWDETLLQKTAEQSLGSPWDPLETDDEEDPELLEGAVPAPLPASIHTPSSEALSACPPPVHALFEEVIETLQVVHRNGDTHVSFLFNSRAPKHALLAGTRITLREFSTAPKVFNIEIATFSTTAQQLIQTHAPALLEAFHQGSFSFSVERLDVEFETEEFSPSDEEESTP